MTYATHLMLVLTSLSSIDREVKEEIERVLDGNLERLQEIVLQYLLSEVTPGSTFDFEERLAEQVRELARQLVERVFNRLESDDYEQAPHDVKFDAGGYRRRNQKTRNSNVSTLFGNITLYRYSYRYWHRGHREPAIFPLELQLGLVHGATPALAEAASRYTAQSGATQRIVLDRLKTQHGVRWGPQRLRDVNQAVARGMEQFRLECQVQKILELMEIAHQSRGRCLPVLAVGRDGVTLREYRYSFYEHATAGTVTVYDRRGKRLGTVYLGFVPESGQGRMTEQLTSLIETILRRWQGRLPRLCYVTDAGDNETSYFHEVLRNMRHPVTGQRLGWTRIVDYFHTSQRIWTMAEALFGKEQEQQSQAWARRMCRLLKKPNGPSRVLHSAGALRARRRLPKSRQEEYRKASNYIRCRTRFMQYHDYQKLHLPIGSGVTEAACKTIFAQRLKLSGMRWGKEGAQVVLDLRVSLLSGIWPSLYRRLLETQNDHQPEVYRNPAENQPKIAA